MAKHEPLYARTIVGAVPSIKIEEFPRSRKKATGKLGIRLRPTFTNSDAAAQVVAAKTFLQNCTLTVKLRCGKFLCNMFPLYALDLLHTLEEENSLATDAANAVDKSIAGLATEVEEYNITLDFLRRFARKPTDGVLSLAEVDYIEIKFGATGNANVTVSQCAYVVSHFYTATKAQKFGVLHRYEMFPISGQKNDYFTVDGERVVSIYFASLDAADPVSDNLLQQVQFDNDPVVDWSNYGAIKEGVQARGELFYRPSVDVLAYNPASVIALYQAADYGILELDAVRRIDVKWGTANITTTANAVFIVHTIIPCDSALRVKRIGSFPGLSAAQLDVFQKSGAIGCNPSDEAAEFLPFEFDGSPSDALVRAGMAPGGCGSC